MGIRPSEIPPSYVNAYVKRSKNDAADAAAICEAAATHSMRIVPVKTVVQQSTLSVHRTRDLLIGQRTQFINALRAHLAELGIVAQEGRDGLARLIAMISEEGALQQALRAIIAQFASCSSRSAVSTAASRASGGRAR